MSLKISKRLSPNPQWMQSMKEEMNIIYLNNTWRLILCDPNMKIVGSKWALKTNLNVDGSIDRHKAHLFANGYN